MPTACLPCLCRYRLRATPDACYSPAILPFSCHLLLLPTIPHTRRFACTTCCCLRAWRLTWFTPACTWPLLYYLLRCWRLYGSMLPHLLLRIHHRVTHAYIPTIFDFGPYSRTTRITPPSTLPACRYSTPQLPVPPHHKPHAVPRTHIT